MTDEADRKGNEVLVDDSWDYNSQQQIPPTEIAQAHQEPNLEPEEVKQEEEVKTPENASDADKLVVD